MFDSATPGNVTVATQDDALQTFLHWFDNRSGDPLDPARIVGLQGGAGTGKTYLTSQLVWALLRLRAGAIRIVIAAPSHKALGVIRRRVETHSESAKDLALLKRGAPGNRRKLPLKWTTVASLLGDRVIRQHDGRAAVRHGNGRDEHTDADLLIIDETSMIPLETGQRIARAYPNVPILFVGDPGQLPPVDGSRTTAEDDANQGRVLSDAFTLCSSIQRLDQPQRVRKPGPLQRLFVAFRQSDVAMDKDAHPALCTPREGEERDAFVISMGLPELHRRLAAHIRKGNDVTIIAWQNRTVVAHNKALHRQLFPDSPGFCVNEPVMATETWPAGPGTALLYNSERLEVLEAGSVRKNIFLGLPTQKLMLSPIEREDDEPISVEVPVDEYQFNILMQKRGEALHKKIEVTRASVSPRSDAAHFREFFNLDDFPTKQSCVIAIAASKGFRPPADAGDDEKAERAAYFRARKYLTPQKTEIVEATWARAASLHKTRNRIAPLRHAYCLTNHRGQGSTLGEVVIDMEDLWNIPLTEERARAVYTAVTRASSRLTMRWSPPAPS